MRLLFLAPSPPTPATGGGALRMFHMVRWLAGRYAVDVVGPDGDGADLAREIFGAHGGVTLDFVRPATGAVRRRLFRLGPYVKDPALAAAVARKLEHGAYDVVQVEKPAMLPYLPARNRVPVVLDLWAYGLTGAVRALARERGVGTRIRNAVRLARFAAFDRVAWPPLAAMLVTSDGERRQCEAAHPGPRVTVVPNGVDCAAVRPPASQPAGPPIVLFTGDMGFEPNVEAAELLARDVFPAVRAAHRDAHLVLAGRRPHARVRALAGDGVTVTGDVADMRPHLHAASVYAAPQFLGAGPRTKVLEAFAAGLPVVASAPACEGMDVVDGRDVVLIRDAAACAGAIVALLGDGGRRARLGAAARRLAEKRYDWERCLAPLGELYGDLAAAVPS